MPDQVGPATSRPHIPGYGIPEGREGMLEWGWAEERLTRAPTYWVATMRPDGRPHATPVWGAWVEGALHFEGGAHTRRGRNLAANPAVAVHVERGDEVVILEGVAKEIAAPEPGLASRLVAAYDAKYHPRYGYRADPDNWRTGGLYVVRATVAFGWARFPEDATRWHFHPA